MTVDAETRAKYLELKAKADAARAAAKPAEEAAREAMQPYFKITDEIEELLDGADVAKCESCSGYIFSGDQCSYDSEGGIYFCEDCSPTWREMLREPESFYNWVDGEQVYHTQATANAAAEAHVSNGGALTDKLGLRAY